MKNIALPLTLFYDASCPLCRQEIEMLRTHDTSAHLILIDCSPVDFSGLEGRSRAEMMALIHARDASGRWYVGPTAFSAAYRSIGVNSIAFLWGAAILQPMWRVLYPWIAKHRNTLSNIGLFKVSMWLLTKYIDLGSRTRAKRMATNACTLNRDCNENK